MQSNTPLLNVEGGTFQVTHPFHPLYGKTSVLVTCRCNWGEERVYYHDEAGTLCCLPLTWTNLTPIDLFVHVSAGRAAFRVADLLELSSTLASLTLEQEK
jgi:hypothetical protein